MSLWNTCCKVFESEIISKNQLIRLDEDKNSLFNDKIILRSQQRFRSDHHRVYTEEVNKVALSSNDDKIIQTYDKITTYPYGTSDIKVCENEMLSKNKFCYKVNNESQVLKNKSQVLRNEAQTLTNKSQILRNELEELRNEGQVLRNKSQELINEAQVLRHEAQVPKNKSWIIRNKSQIPKNK